MSSRVARIDRYKPSRRLQAAAIAERERVEAELLRLDREQEQLAARMRELQRARQDLRDELSTLNRLAHDDGRTAEGEVPARRGKPGRNRDLSATAPDAKLIVLRGARIRELAVQVLARSDRAYDPVHYRDWYAMLVEAGFVPAGKEPLASFLTQLGRSPAVRRTSEPGVYQLDHDFAERATSKLHELQTQLRRLHDLPREGGLRAVMTEREQRSRLTAEVEDLERQLDEALRSLGMDDENRAAAR